LLLDEATSHLDVHHALDILDQLRRRVRGGGLTVVAVMHDLNLAAAHADRMVFLDGGAVAAEGGTGEVFREEVIDRVFGVRSAVQSRPGGGSFALFSRAAEDGRGV
ncbi:MAG: ATP-binding cassette domain-containing protein, partial [Deferrisomatales bacterium]